MVIKEMIGKIHHGLTLAMLPCCLLACSVQSAKQADTDFCKSEGGSMVMSGKRGDGTSYPICLFEDNYQCGLDALRRKACPPGGLRITGYITPASRYCALTGGHYEPARNECTWQGITCPAGAYYNNTCQLPFNGPHAQ